MRFPLMGVAWTAVLAGSAPMEAQRVAPAVVVDSFVRLLKAEQYSLAATLVDPVTFAEARRRRVANARADSARPPMTAERLLSMDSSISPAMAQWMEQSLRERAAKPGRLGELSMEFTGVTSLAQLEALTEADATARWLEAHDPNRQYRLILRSLACTPPLTDSERQSAPFTLTTLGVVTVDDTLAFALVSLLGFAPRTALPVVASGKPVSWELRRRRDGWRVTPDELVLSGPFLHVGRLQCQPLPR